MVEFITAIDISHTNFENTVDELLNIDLNSEENEVLKNIVSAPSDENQFIVAGPGTGKTTTLVLRILYLLFVESKDPKSIMATTFTRKAAEELTSRIIGWGTGLQENFSDQNAIDFNQVKVGTLDSLINDALTETQRIVGTVPTVIDPIGSAIIMTRLFFRLDSNVRWNLQRYLLSLHSIEDTSPTPFNSSPQQTIRRLLSISQRLIENLVDPIGGLDVLSNDEYPPRENYDLNAGELHQEMLQIIFDYWDELRERRLFTYSTLNLLFAHSLEIEVPQNLIDRIIDDELFDNIGDYNTYEQVFNELQFLFVDEYQDTNYLQERIYFEIMRNVQENQDDYSISVVGDDDQAIFRFRGSNVSFFNNFSERYLNEREENVEPYFISNNYRSTSRIINFVNRFINLNPIYQEMRVPEKPSLDPRQDYSHNTPIVIIQNDENSDNPIENIAEKVTNLILRLSNDGYNYSDDQPSIRIAQPPNRANIALLMQSVQEFSFSGDPRLPGFLRDKLQEEGINIHNPRGLPLSNIQEVQQLLGLLLIILDDDMSIQNDTYLTEGSAELFQEWRNSANDFIDDFQDDTSPDLNAFITNWTNKIDSESGEPWESERIFLPSLLYQIITWIPFFRDDREGIVYFSALINLANQLTLVASFGSYIIYRQDNLELWNASVKDVIRNFLIPITEETVELDETLMDTYEDDRINVFTIHQSKGLEFPVVIVDLGSYFTRNHHLQRKFRFPRDSSGDVIFESRMELPFNLDDDQIDLVDRAFGDLIRKFFVAYSRAKELLVLVGHRKIFGNARTPIRTVQLGWIRDEDSSRGLLGDDFINYIFEEDEVV